jgi:hypothetical protein
VPNHRSLRQAFDEIQFGASNTLNLREGLPTAVQAVARCEAWLRERQMARAGEVLVITGAGRGSPGGVPVVREAVRKLLTALSRRGVVRAVREHSPGAYAVQLAPITALFDGGRRKREPRPTRPADPPGLEGLEPETLQMLRHLAARSLERLGATGLAEAYVADEMTRQFAALGASVPEGAERERRLREVIRRAVAALDEA